MRLLTTGQVATRLGVDSSTVVRYRLHGLRHRGGDPLFLPCRAIEKFPRRRLLFDPADVRRFKAVRKARGL